MNKLICSGFISLLSLHSIQGLAKDSEILTFTMEPVIPQTINAGDTVESLVYEIKNNLSSTISIKANILDAAGKPDNTIVTRNSVDGGTCKESLAAHKACTLIYDITAPDDKGATVEQTLQVEYINGREGYDITSDIKFDVTSNMLHVTNYYDPGAVSQCALDLSSCSEFTDPLLANITGIAFATINSKKYSYMTNLSGGVVKCDFVNDQNQACVSIPGLDIAAFGIAFLTIGQELQAYLTDFTNNEVMRCNVSNTDGMLSACTSLSVGQSELLDSPTYITFKPLGSATYAYIGNLSQMGNAMVKCTVNEQDGSFSNCGTITGACSGAANITGSMQVAFAQAGSTEYAYISTEGGVYQCQVAAENGSLNFCGLVEGNFSFAAGIVSELIDNQSIVYVANLMANTVSACLVDPVDGALDCVESEPKFNFPAGLALH